MVTMPGPPRTGGTGATLLALLVLGAPAAAQAPGAVEGVVTDGEAPVFAAAVSVMRQARAVATVETDSVGAFAVQGLAAGRYTVRVQRLGFAELSRLVTVRAGETTRVELVLQQAPVALEGVRVEAERSRERIRFEEEAGVTARELSSEELKLVPGVAEADPLRAVEVLPGVVSTSDFSSTFHVRGGSQDQNLILLDGVPIVSPFHLGGLFSVFNADMVERVELQSGGFPARYGGRVSSVLEVTADPGPGHLAVDGGVSLLAARVSVAGGASAGVRDALGLSSLRWRVSGRRSYFDQILRPFFDFPYHLADLQGVLDAGLGGRDHLRVTAYTGADVLDLTRLDDEDFPLRLDWDWGNDAVGLSWERDLARGTWSTSAAWTRFATGLVFPDFDDTEFRSALTQGRVATDVEMEALPWLELGGGIQLEHLGYDNLARTGGTDFSRGRGTGDLVGGYLQANWGWPGRWLMETGLRLDHWSPDRAETVAEAQPRLAAKWFFGDADWAVKASVGRYAQFMHSMRDEELPLGLDVWILAGARAPHVVSDQYQVGVETYAVEDWTFALEAYLRRFDGVVSVNGGDDPNTELDDVLRGRGTSWGADLLVRRSGHDVSGWLALSFLKATRTFPDPLAPDPLPPEVTYAPIFDRRLDVDLVLRFPFPGGWEAGTRLNVGTGVPYTRPIASYAAYQPRFLRGGGRFSWTGEEDDQGGYAVLLGDRNGSRYPTYHRLDLTLRRTFEYGWGVLTPHLDLLNLYNRRNVLFYFYELDEHPPRRAGVSMFPLLPTLGVEVRFR